MDKDTLEEIIETALGALNEANRPAGTCWYALPPDAAPNKLVFFLLDDDEAIGRGLMD